MLIFLISLFFLQKPRAWGSANQAPSKPQDKNNTASHGRPAARVPNADTPPALSAWGQPKQTAPSSPSKSGMHYVKTGSGTPTKQDATTASTGGGTTSSWAALLGGGGSGAKTTPPSASPKAAAAAPISTTSVAANVSPDATHQPESTPSSSPCSPRSFSFKRGNGVVLVHEAPLSPTASSSRSPTSPIKFTSIHNGGSTSNNNDTATTDVPSASIPALSWAEKAKLAAAQAPAAAALPPPRKAVVASQRKQNAKAAAAQVTSPKRGGGQGNPRSPGGVGARPQQHQKKDHHHHHQQQQQRSHGEGRQQQRHEKTRSTTDQVPGSHLPNVATKKPATVETLDAPKLLSVVSEPEQQVAPEVKEEADVQVKENDAAAIVEEENQTTQPSTSSTAPAADVEEALDILCSSLASWRLPQNNQTAPSLLQQRVQPRGIKNPGNLCFVNAVLQGLMGSSSFCHILLALRSLANAKDQLLDIKTYPVLSAMVDVASEFQKLPENVTVVDKKTDTDATKPKNNNVVMVLGGHPVSSALIMEIIDQFAPRQRPGDDNKGVGGGGYVEQEDAHEFLHFLLDKMDSELVSLRKSVKKDTGNSGGTDKESGSAGDGDQEVQDGFEDDDDGWLVKSGKKAVRQQEVSAVASNEAASIITSLFQGKFATSVACAGAPNSVTVHPFMIVELPIYADSIRSISDSLDALTAPEVLEDYKPGGGAIPQQAAKTERFLHLPDVLVLHLMRFQYTGKSAKISKYIAFEPRLAMKSSWMATGTPDRGAVYNLVATVTHHGKTISRGHYTADVVQQDGKWLRFDDSDVYWVKEQQVLSDTPYLLVYQRQR
jgi:ubiquitin C-terminal hydrolase